MECWAIRQKFRNPNVDMGYGSYHLQSGDEGSLADLNAMLWYNPMAANAESRLSMDSNPPLEAFNMLPELKPDKLDQWADECLVDEAQAIGASFMLQYGESSAQTKTGTDQSMVHSSITCNNSTGQSSSSTVVEEQQSQISDVDDDDDDGNERHLRQKYSEEIVDSKKKRKRRTERGSKVTFKTKSESDALEDGYKWRKYGRKFVKSSPHPRSYYRCADKHCDVKKRVERDPKDPGFLITTYEGTHNHESPSVIYYIGKPIILPQHGAKPAILLFNAGLC